MPPRSEFYRNTYIDTQMQRYELAMQMAASDAAQQFAIAQMLAQQLASLDKSIADIQGAKTTDELTQRLKVAGLKQTVISDAMRRKISIYEDVQKQFDVSPSLASVNTAADKFGSSLSAAGTIQDKARRQAGTVSGYTPGSNQALAVAATTFSTFKAEAERNGYGTQFTAAEADIKNEIAKRFGVDAKKIDTVDAVKDTLLQDRLKTEGGQAVGDTELKQIEALVGGNATPQQKQEALDQLLARRAKLTDEQLNALERSSLTPEQKMQRAREIYNTQLGPESYKNRGLQEYQSYFNRLPPEMQKITLGYQQVKPQDVKFMEGRRSAIVGDKEKEVAFDLYYALEKDRRAGKQPAYLVHEKVEQFFPNDERAQQRVLGYIFRQTEKESGIGIDMAKNRQKDLDEYLIGEYGRTAPSDEEILDDLLAGRIGLIKPPEPDTSLSGPNPQGLEAAFGGVEAPRGPKPEDVEVGDKPPGGPGANTKEPTPPSVYTFDATLYNQSNPYATLQYKGKPYSYFIKEDGSYGMIGTTGKVVDISNNATAQKEAEEELAKFRKSQEEAFKAQQAAPQE